jgi:hypothetical protein
MDWIKQKFLKAFLVDWIEGLLSKIPGNGYKTVISVALTAVIFVTEILGYQVGTLGEFLLNIQEWLAGLGAVPLMTVTVMAAGWGAAHKLWKWVRDMMELAEATKDEAPK